MTNKVPSTHGTDFALWLMGFDAWERQAILESAARMTLTRGVYIDPVLLATWLIDGGAIATLGLLAGRRETRR